MKPKGARDKGRPRGRRQKTMLVKVEGKEVSCYVERPLPDGTEYLPPTPAERERDATDARWESG